MVEFITVQDSDLQEIEGERRRVFRAMPVPLSARVILDDIRSTQRRRVIAICNTVSASQGLFSDLKHLDAGNELDIILLHSRFLPADRARKEASLVEAFAKSGQKPESGKCSVLISTQVIEAGINITCEVMHSHLSPMNSLLQRAGRCARFGGEQGEVRVYRSVGTNSQLAEREIDSEPADSFDKKRLFLPYPDDLCELTWQVLQEHAASDRAELHVGFRLEEKWIDRVHREQDLLQLQRRENNRMSFEEKFNAAVFTGDESTARDLIRDVDSRSVFVWEDSGRHDEQVDPTKIEPFSLPVSTLCKVFREWLKLEGEKEWLFKRVGSPRAETYDLPVGVAIDSLDKLKQSAIIMANYRYVSYTPEVGLLLGVDVERNQFSSPLKQQKQTAGEYKYRMDTYVGHLGCMWTSWRESFTTARLKNGVPVGTEYASVRDELLQAGGRFIKGNIFPETPPAEAEALFEYLVFLAVITHDLGKLQVKWQEMMRGWQAIAHQQFNGTPPKSHLLAHTDYNPDDPAQKKALREYEEKHRRPPHAIESAFLARDILKQSLARLLEEHFNAGEEEVRHILWTVVISAGRHHSAWAAGWTGENLPKGGKIVLHRQAQQAIAASWRGLSRFLPATWPLPEANLRHQVYHVKNFELNKFEPDETVYLQLYWLVVRALRLCDQRAVQW